MDVHQCTSPGGDGRTPLYIVSRLWTYAAVHRLEAMDVHCCTSSQGEYAAGNGLRCTRVYVLIAVNGGSDCYHWSFSSPVVVSTSDSRNSGQQSKQIFEMDVHCCTSSRGEYAAGSGHRCTCMYVMILVQITTRAGDQRA
jgi:hypothetical protein